MASLDKLSLNNQIVSMRSDVKVAKQFAINKIVKEVRMLQKKNGTEAQKNKYIRKSKRLIDEIYLIKKFKNDEVSKFMLTSTEDPLSIINNPKGDPKIKALAKVCRNNILKASLIEFKKKFPNWSTEVPLLLPHLGKKVKKKNKLNLKENVFVGKSMDFISKNETTVSYSNLVNTAGNNGFLIESTTRQPAKRLQAEEGKQKVKKIKEKLKVENEVLEEFSHLDEDVKKVQQNAKTKFQEKVKIPKTETKVVDPFFVTSDNTEYLTVATSEKQIEALKNTSLDMHNKANNKFGSPKKFDSDKHFDNNKKFSYIDKESNFHSKRFEKRNFKEKINFKNANFNNFYKGPRLHEGKAREISEEKLHPSWEAKKKLSSLTQFTGKKIVFNDDE